MKLLKGMPRGESCVELKERKRFGRFSRGEWMNGDVFETGKCCFPKGVVSLEIVGSMPSDQPNCAYR